MTSCEMGKCDRKARYLFSISTGSVTKCCGVCLIRLVRASRMLVRKNNVGLYIQRIGEMSG